MPRSETGMIENEFAKYCLQAVVSSVQRRAAIELRSAIWRIFTAVIAVSTVIFAVFHLENAAQRLLAASQSGPAAEILFFSLVALVGTTWIYILSRRPSGRRRENDDVRLIVERNLKIFIRSFDAAVIAAEAAKENARHEAERQSPGGLRL